jgi:membrane-bound ClpP family serine protease
VPNWSELQQELLRAGNAHDVIRRRYLSELSTLTGRNTIVYYSGWQQKPTFYEQQAGPFTVNDQDKSGFMTTIHGMDRSQGLDLILHTPGGDLAATESLVSYLRAMFKTDIRAIVPQLAMSAGTMIACACNEILMGLHSSIGPIDPQIGGVPAHGILDEFRRAADDIKQDPAKVPVWQPIIAKYHPTLIGEAQNAITLAHDIVDDWLKTGMFKDAKNPGPKARANRVMKDLASHALTLSHSRHIGLHHAQALGLNVTPLEADDQLQDAVLTVHHLCEQTLAQTAVIKLIENQNGVTFAQAIGVQTVALNALHAPPAAQVSTTS